MAFIKANSFSDPLPENAWIFVFSGHRILIDQALVDQAMVDPADPSSVAVPFADPDRGALSGLKEMCPLGLYNGVPCYCAAMTMEAHLPPGYAWVNLRQVYARMPEEIRGIAGYARQIYDWNRNNRFCGRCGQKMQDKSTERAKICTDCSLVSYPRISPAIITAVVRGGEILLARGVGFPNKKMFSVLAGFVEPGESLEDCVRREIFEEVGIRVGHIRYMKSQPWPFPDSLMLGFTAEYKSGQICIDPGEIAEAAWFKADELPLTPGKETISGELIQWFVNCQR